MINFIYINMILNLTSTSSNDPAQKSSKALQRLKA